MTDTKGIRKAACGELSATDSLMFFVETLDELLSVFESVASRGGYLTVEQIVEELLPPEDASPTLVVDHCYALAMSLAIMIQRAVTG